MYKGLKFIAILCLLITTSCSKEELIFSLNQENASSEMLSDIENDIIKLVNEHRTTLNKETLTVNILATKLAKEHTDYMIEHNKISHDYFQNRHDALVAKANASTAGENVASHYDTAQKVVDAWLSSTEHKENIEGNYTHIGIAAKKDSNGKYYFTQIFYR